MRYPALGLRRLACVTGFALLAFSTWAYADPPSRIARLGYISGPVSFSPAGQHDWVQATLNRPLTTGDRLWADAGSRAEIQVGGATVRMQANTSVSVLNLDDRIAQVQLSQGRLKVRVRRLGPTRCSRWTRRISPSPCASLASTASRSTPTAAQRPSWCAAARPKPTAKAHRMSIDSRQPYRFYGTGLPDYEQLAAPRDDDLDRWSRERDRRYDNSLSARYVSPEVVGYQDLDANGTWRVDAELRQRLDAEPRGRRLDALPRRPLGLGRPLGLDLGRRRALGLRRVALRPLGQHRRHLGLGAGPGAQQAVYAPALVVFVGGNNFQLTHLRRPVGGVALVPAGAARGLSTVLCGEPRLLRSHQSQQHRRQQHQHPEHLQHHERDEHRLCQPLVPGAVIAVPTTASCNRSRYPGPRCGCRRKRCRARR